jgi:hypothetical protein
MEELLFWYQNGEFKVEKHSLAFLRDLVKDLEPVKVERVQESGYGYFRREIYRLSSGRKIIFETWIPSEGYCWDEVRVLLIKR